MKDSEIYELMSPALLTADAHSFNVADWTLMAYVAGHTNFTGHSKTVIPEGPVLSAKVTFCLQNEVQSSPCQARMVGMTYNASNQQVWHRGWGSVTQNTSYNVAQLNQIVTDHLAAHFQSNGYFYGFVEVKGAGKLYMATLSVDWQKPDFVDYSLAIADLVTRVTALESGNGGNGVSSYDDTELRERTIKVEEKLAKVVAALV